MNSAIQTDGGPAFPQPPTGGFGPQEGLTMRDYFAAHALANESYVDSDTDADQLAIYAYDVADAMLLVRQVPDVAVMDNQTLTTETKT